MYCKIEYYENGHVKSIESKGLFVSFKGSISDLKQDDPNIKNSKVK